MKTVAFSVLVTLMGAAAQAQLSVYPSRSFPASAWTTDVAGYPGVGTYANAPTTNGGGSANQSVTLKYGVQLVWDGAYGAPPATLNFAYDVYDVASAMAYLTWSANYPGTAYAKTLIRTMTAETQRISRPASGQTTSPAGSTDPTSLHRVTNAIPISWQFVSQTNKYLATVDTIESVTSTSYAEFISARDLDSGAYAYSAESYANFVRVP